MSLCLQLYQGCSRMIRNQEQKQEDEFIAVRVQDPRVQNEESWYSYVDFKIFLHSNSKAFTAKTSCVRRRYSEFVWLKKKLQKNSGLVPVPELPPKTPFFSVNNDDFIEKRREGLQQFLEKVVNRTVFLSDSQLHLFLQTQLSPAQIEACVQGHAPCSVTTAILRYASSNQGCAQEEGGWAMQEDHERILPLFYESPDSPAPHLQPSECESSSEISLVESDAHA
ncbi:sorting nexin-11-like [Acipenser ruthenus]|uniref:sorting nexin-11-like n=1 Tax=Acipenser ruthenus TaxID=7906 RepID=UPI0027428A9D|nr:sorting nexin-11-like [Acipenser ruthenus]XP_033913308.2 sorting nexin-11-like [Acipenser ruthenus]XP_033913309.2 sorting nexin-11-like [Acipenser ruthenus]